MIEKDLSVYLKWLLEDQAKPLKAVHFLYEYLIPLEKEGNGLTIEEELYLLDNFVKLKGKEIEGKKAIDSLIKDIEEKENVRENNF